MLKIDGAYWTFISIESKLDVDPKNRLKTRLCNRKTFFMHELGSEEKNRCYNWQKLIFSDLYEKL